MSSVADAAGEVRVALDGLHAAVGPIRLALDNVDAALADGKRWIVKDNGVWAQQRAARVLEEAAKVYAAARLLADAAQDQAARA